MGLDIEEMLPHIRKAESKISNELWHGFDCNYGVYTYYADYVKIGYQYAPITILEFGVKFGYSGIALCKGAHLKIGETIQYFGVDIGFFENSNALAKKHFSMYPYVNCNFFKHDLFSGIPCSIKGKSFDLVHVDAAHTMNGILNELGLAFKVVKQGGVVVCDDYNYAHVKEPIDLFLSEYPLVKKVLVNNERGQIIIEVGSASSN